MESPPTNPYKWIEIALVVCVIVAVVCVCVPVGYFHASASENTAPEPYSDSYGYFYPSVTLQCTSGSDFYTASVAPVGTPAIPVFTVTEPYSGIDYYEIRDPSTNIVTAYQLIPPTGGVSLPNLTFNTPFYVAANITIPLTVTETTAEWVAQVITPASSSVSYVLFTGTYSQFRIHLYDNYLNSLVLQFSADFSTSFVEIRVDALSSSVYANNIRTGIDTFIYYDEGYEDGYVDGTNEGYDEGYEDGYVDGTNEGYDEGYDKGYTEGSDASFNPFQWILRLLDAIFSFELIPLGDKGITIGGLLTIVLAIPLIRLILDFFAGG